MRPPKLSLEYLGEDSQSSRHAKNGLAQFLASGSQVSLSGLVVQCPVEVAL